MEWERGTTLNDLMVDYITSLDGFGAAEGWPGLWGMGGQEYFTFLDEDARAEYTLLMGAGTYRLFASFGDEGMEQFATRHKVVFSSSLRQPLAWDNTTVVETDAVDAVREMKSDGLALRTIGSPSLVRSLLAAGLVDRYRVVVFPVVNGATGRDRIYDGWPDVALDLVTTRTFDGTLQLFEFRPTVLEGPPGSISTP
jgi:dihydrofolate reductase